MSPRAEQRRQRSGIDSERRRWRRRRRTDGGSAGRVSSAAAERSARLVERRPRRSALGVVVLCRPRRSKDQML